MYDDIIRGLDNLEESGVRKGLFMVAVPETIGQASDIMIELSHKYAFKRIGYSIPHWTKGEQNIVTPEQYRDALLSLYRHRKDILAEVMQVNWRIAPLAMNEVKRFSCSLHTQQTTLLPDKSIVRCSKIDHDDQLKACSNDDLDNGCPLSQAESIERSPCRTCIALGACGGGCPFDGLKRFGTIIDKRECIITPPLINAAISDIVNALDKEVDLPDGEIPAQKIQHILFD